MFYSRNIPVQPTSSYQLGAVARQRRLTGTSIYPPGLHKTLGPQNKNYHHSARASVKVGQKALHFFLRKYTLLEIRPFDNCF